MTQTERDIRWVTDKDDAVYWHADDLVAALEYNTEAGLDDAAIVLWLRETVLPTLRQHAFTIQAARSIERMTGGDVQALPAECEGCGSTGDCYDGCRLGSGCATCGGAGSVPDYDQPVDPARLNHPAYAGLETHAEGAVWYVAVDCPACAPPTTDVHSFSQALLPSGNFRTACECGHWLYFGTQGDGIKAYARHLERVG